MKTAVFQIDEGNGTLHLICVPMKSLQLACSLEASMQLCSHPKHRVTLLGRYASVHLAANETDAEALVLRSSYTPLLEGPEDDRSREFESLAFGFALTRERKIR
jgi:hypothetical protein